jgi:hypothetical protein
MYKAASASHARLLRLDAKIVDEEEESDGFQEQIP